MMTDLKTQIDNMAKQGVTILKAWPGESGNIVDTAGELQSTIPQMIQMQVQGGKLTTETTLIALSPDKGKSWYFIDAAGKSLAELKGLFPNLSSSLVIPEPVEPKFEEDK